MGLGLKRWSVSVCLIGGLAYFGGHAMTGEQGVLAWAETKHAIATSERTLEELRERQVVLSDHARRLRDDTLDLDYLDERARVLAGMAHPRDVIAPASALPPALAARVDVAADRP